MVQDEAGKIGRGQNIQILIDYVIDVSHYPNGIIFTILFQEVKVEILKYLKGHGSGQWCCEQNLHIKLPVQHCKKKILFTISSYFSDKFVLLTSNMGWSCLGEK